MEIHGLANRERSHERNMETHGVGADFATQKAGDENEKETESYSQGFILKQRAEKEERSHKRWVDKRWVDWVDWRDANEQETDGKGTASVKEKETDGKGANSKQRPKLHDQGVIPLFRSLHISDRLVPSAWTENNFFFSTEAGRSTFDIPKGGGGTVGMDIQVPDDSQARAKAKVTEEKLEEIPDDIPTREREGWKEKRKPKAKGNLFFTDMGMSTIDIPEGGAETVGMNIQLPGDMQARAKVKVTEEKLEEIPDDIPTREREDSKEKSKPKGKRKRKRKRKGKGKVKVTGDKLGEVPDDVATREREDWKEKNKPKVKKEEKLKPKRKPKVENLKEWDRWWCMDSRDQVLLRAFFSPELKWEEKVLDILHVVRCRGFTEYNKKKQRYVRTRFCPYNIAFFDLDKDSEDAPWLPIHRISQPIRNWLDDSVNVVAIKVAQSDRKGPISIYGTVLARDEYDYRCFYLFRRGRDDPQLITPKDRTLTLISPIRAFAVSDSMFFEFNLKIKGGDDADEDFSKGFIEHSAIRNTKQPTIKSLDSCLSTMELVYTPVPSALEASIAVSILKAPSDFTSKVTAWTTGNDENKIVLYDSQGAGTRTKLGPGETVSGLVDVPLGEELVLYVSLADEVQHQPEECFTLVIGPDVGKGTLEQGSDVGERTLEQGPYRMQVKISWKGVVNHQPGFKLWGRPNMWGYLAGRRVLLS